MARNPWEMTDEELATAAAAPAPAGASGVIYGSPRPPAPRAPPTGYRETDNGFAYVPGGPADPAVIAQVAAAGRAPATGTSGGDLTAEARSAALARIAAARQLRTQLQDFERQFQGYEGRTTLPEALAMLGINTPGGVARAQASSAGMMPLARQAFRVPGSGADSEREGMYLERIIPDLSTYDETTRQRIDQLYRMIEDTEREQNTLLGRETPATQPEVAVVPPGADRSSQVTASSPGGAQQLGEGGTTLQEDPVLRGLSGRLGAMIASGASDQEIRGVLQGAGVNPSDTNIDTVLGWRRGPEFRTWRSQNPNAPYPIGPSFFTREVPRSGIRSTIANWGNSAPGAYFANAGDALTLGTLDNLTDNPGQARAGMSALRGDFPLASLAGTVTGGALAAGGGELVAARFGVPAARAAIAGDALWGAGYGAGSADEGSRFAGAALGGATGVAGGMFGRRIGSGIGRSLTGARDASTQYLTSRGIPLTMGQIAGGGGVVGRAIRGMEDRLESVPLLGNAIQNRRADGYNAFNREAFDQALAPINATTGGRVSEEGVEAANNAVSGAYQGALSGVRVQPDQRLATDLQAAFQRGSNLPGGMSDDFSHVIQTRVYPELQSGALTGEGYQAIRQALRQERQAWKGQPRGHDFGQALRDVEGALEGVVRRQAPEAVEGLNAADRAYGLTRTVANAVERGKQTGGVFTPAQLGISASQSGRRYGGTQSTTARPFFDLQRSAQERLPPTIPNSGTVDRGIAVAALPAAAGGAAYSQDWVSPEVAALLALTGLPYTRGGAAGIQKLLTARPQRVRDAGERLLQRKGMFGAIGAGAAPPLLLAPQ